MSDKDPRDVPVYFTDSSNKNYYPILINPEFNEKNEAFLPKEGIVSISYYFPKEGNSPEPRFRNLESKSLSHLNFPDVAEECPKIFILESVLRYLELSSRSIFLSLDQIKSLDEVPNAKAYFEIFKSEEPEDIFSDLYKTNFFQEPLD